MPNLWRLTKGETTMPWVIKLTGDDTNKQKAYGTWGRHYFPRRFHYKIDVIKLWDRLTALGIKSEYKREK